MRKLTGMLAAMLICSAFAQAQSSDSLFTPCAAALATQEFAPLRSVIPEGLRESGGCLRLTNREFLLFANPQGPGHPFLYCDLRVASPRCEDDSGFLPYAFTVEREFRGGGGKRFMLWSTFNLRRGQYSSGYGIFSLVPKSQAPRGFAVYSLPVGDLRSMVEGDDSQPCKQLEDAQATRVSGFEVKHEGTRDVELWFASQVTDCASGSTRTRHDVFHVVDGRFVPASPPAPR